MPDRLQSVFSEGGVVELLLKIDGEVRALRVDASGASWGPEFLDALEVKTALIHWMIETDAEGWIGSAELTSVLKGRGVDVEKMVRNFPARPT